jgi:hypothetical protein
MNQCAKAFGFHVANDNRWKEFRTSWGLGTVTMTIQTPEDGGFPIAVVYTNSHIREPLGVYISPYNPFTRSKPCIITVLEYCRLIEFYTHPDLSLYRSLMQAYRKNQHHAHHSTPECHLARLPREILMKIYQYCIYVPVEVLKYAYP